MAFESLNTLLDMNRNQFKEEGDSLVVFTHWFLLQNNFNLIENAESKKGENQFNMDSKRQPDGGFQLNYSINNHKMEVLILRSQEYMTVYFMPEDGSTPVDFRLKIKLYTHIEQNIEGINQVPKLQKLYTTKINSLEGSVAAELKKDKEAAASSSDPIVSKESIDIDNVLNLDTNILSPETQDEICKRPLNTPPDADKKKKEDHSS